MSVTVYLRLKVRSGNPQIKPLGEGETEARVSSPPALFSSARFIFRSLLINICCKKIHPNSCLNKNLTAGKKDEDNLNKYLRTESLCKAYKIVYFSDCWTQGQIYQAVEPILVPNPHRKILLKQITVRYICRYQLIHGRFNISPLASCSYQKMYYNFIISKYLSVALYL